MDTRSHTRRSCWSISEPLWHHSVRWHTHPKYRRLDVIPNDIRLVSSQISSDLVSSQISSFMCHPKYHPLVSSQMSFFWFHPKYHPSCVIPNIIRPGVIPNIIRPGVIPNSIRPGVIPNSIIHVSSQISSFMCHPKYHPLVSSQMSPDLVSLTNTTNLVASSQIWLYPMSSKIP